MRLRRSVSTGKCMRLSYCRPLLPGGKPKFDVNDLNKRVVPG